MKMRKIRNQTKEDQQQVEILVRETYWNLYRPGTDKHLILHLIKKSKLFIPQLTFVVEQDGKIIGYIMYTRGKVHYDNTNNVQILRLGLLTVHQKHQFKGVGTQLINFSLAKAAQLGYQSVYLFGYPKYYEKFGFKCSHQFNIKAPNHRYMRALQILQLKKGSLPKQKEGIIYQPEEFSVDQQQLTEYEKLFPYRQKYKTKSQVCYNSMFQKQWNDEIDIKIEDTYNRQRLVDT